MDDLENLRETIERQKELDKMEKSFVKRKLSFGGDMEERDTQWETRLRHRFDDLADLVESTAWADVERIAKEVILSAYKVPPPNSVDGRVAYETFTIARDVLDQLFLEVRQQASKGTSETVAPVEEVINL